MSRENTTPESENWRFVGRVIVKTMILFLLCNLIFAMVNPRAHLGRFSLYNRVWVGRERLPYGENPAGSYNLSLSNLPAMVNSHRATVSANDVFRVFLVGDSATWGWLLENEDTLSAQLGHLDLTAADGRPVEFHNFGYPVLALSKDLLILDEIMKLEPDMIIWLVTLESFPHEKQLFPPLVQQNGDQMRPLIARYQLEIDPFAPEWQDTTLWERSIWGQRRPLADLYRLQFYGGAWTATGIDQHIPDTFQLRRNDFEDDASWHTTTEPAELRPDKLAFEIIRAGHMRAGDVPLLLVNEPIYVSDGVNSDVRYNSFYPRWAYDQYRDLLASEADKGGWLYVDVWDVVDPDQFTDTPVHMTPDGVAQLALALKPAIERTIGGD